MSNATEQYYVIGDPIAHSLSPAIYTQLFEHYDVAAQYDAMRVTAEALPEFVRMIPKRHVKGFNVTMPLKREIEPFLAYRDPDALYGVNTVCVHPDGLYGYSTDAQGFRTSLAMHGRTYAGQQVVFIGCGGAAKALVHDALNQHAAHITIVNRTIEHASEFANDPRVTVAPWSELADACAHCSLLINTTPLGMHGVAAQFAAFDFLDVLPKTAFVADLVYNPLETALLAAARARELACMNGLGMLVWQGVLAFQKYTNITVPADIAEDVHAHLVGILERK